MGKLTAEEIVELSKRYTLYDWQAQSKASPIAIDRAEGIYFWGVDGQALHRLQQPADGREHRPRRPARDGRDASAGRTPGLHLAVHGVSKSGRCSGRRWPSCCPATSRSPSTRSAAPRRTRTRSRSRRMVTGRHKIMARYRSYHGATTGAMTLTGDPRRWANETRDVRRRARARSRTTARSARRTMRRRRSRCWTRRSSSKGPGTIAAFFLETVTGHERHPRSRPTATCRACESSARSTASCWSSDEVMCGFGPDRRVVRGEPLGRGARHHHVRQGPHVLLRPARARSACAPTIADHFDGQRVLGRPDLQHAPRLAWPPRSPRSPSTKRTT